MLFQNICSDASMVQDYWNLAKTRVRTKIKYAMRPYGVSTQLQSSGLVAHENSTFRNLALAVSGPFMA